VSGFEFIDETVATEGLRLASLDAPRPTLESAGGMGSCGSGGFKDAESFCLTERSWNGFVKIGIFKS
jgi:hypothetical protein